MALDWITIAAQIINFLILVWLLKHFLYRPILDGIDAREHDIKSRVAASEAAKVEAESAATSYNETLKELTSQKAAFLEAAQVEANTERDRLRAETERINEAKRLAFAKQMSADRVSYTEELRAAGASALLSLVGKALGDLADAQLEDQMVAYLSAHLAELGSDLESAANKAEQALATTNLPLSEPCREKLTKAFRTVVADVPLRFETDEGQSAGIVLRFGGGRISWTIDAYLEGLEAEVANQLANGRASHTIAL